MKQIVLVAFDRFTDIDLFLAWDLFGRLPAETCRTRIVAASSKITSSTGITIEPHGRIAETRDADAVYFCSGQGTRALGHLRGRRATTYPSPDLQERLRAAGATAVEENLVIEGNVANAAQCLAGVDLVRWVMTRLFGVDVANGTIATAEALPLATR